MAKAALGATFEVEGESAPAFIVTGFSGIEELSRTYEFEIDLTCQDPNLDLAELIHRRATLSLELPHHRNVHGVIGSMRMSGATQSREYRYRATLVPAMAKLAMSEKSQIYGRIGETSVLDIVQTELTGQQARGAAEFSAARVRPEDVEFRLPVHEHPTRDYVVQYQESTLNFVQRLLEHNGVFYFFNHDGAREKIFFGDNNAAFDNLGDGDDRSGDCLRAAYRPFSENDHWGAPTVHSLVREQHPMPHRLLLREHNYRNPLGMLREPDYLHAEQTVDPNGHGAVVLDGEHFLSNEEGRRLAKIRAEELLSRQELYTGTSTVCRFCPGFIFELSEHARDDCNGRFLITRVHHRAGERLPDEGPAYLNEFTAIPATTPFRPERRTPRPRVSGLFYAHVDATGTGTRAEIDSMGRYKVRIPFDVSGFDRGAASRYVRMAQPYSGFAVPDQGSTGMHFPLLKGTEVIVACINGDPNRPIIVGTVPNAKSGPPVTQENQTKNQLRTASGILMEFEDGSA